MKEPRVSVCIPVFNPGDFLEVAIESVLAQSFADFELLVIDDASTQPVASIVGRFNDHRLRFVENPINLGLVGNWNRCITLAQGDYITIFHQDDLMDRENIEQKVNALDQSPEAGLVYSDILRINENSEVIGGHYIKQPESDEVLPGSQLFAMVAETGNPIACPSVMVRRSCYEYLGLFDGRLPFATDLEMWLRIAKFYSIAYLAQPLTLHRVHAKQETARFSGSGNDYRDILYALDIVFSSKLPPEYIKVSKQAYATLARQSWTMAKWKFGSAKFKAAWNYTYTTLLAIQRSNFANV